MSAFRIFFFAFVFISGFLCADRLLPYFIVHLRLVLLPTTYPFMSVTYVF